MSAYRIPGEVDSYKEEKKKMRFRDAADHFFGACFVAFAIALGTSIALGCVALCYKTITSDKKIDFCYINDSFSQSNRFMLKGHVPYSADRYIYSSDKMEDAIEKAHQLNCEIK